MFKTAFDKDIVLFSIMIGMSLITVAGYPEVSSLLLMIIAIGYIAFKFKALKPIKNALIHEINKKTNGPISLYSGKMTEKYDNVKNYIKINTSLKNTGEGIINKISGTLNYYCLRLIRFLPWLFSCIPTENFLTQIAILIISILSVSFLSVVIAWSSSKKVEKPPLFGKFKK